MVDYAIKLPANTINVVPTYHYGSLAWLVKSKTAGVHVNLHTLVPQLASLTLVYLNDITLQMVRIELDVSHISPIIAFRYLRNEP